MKVPFLDLRVTNKTERMELLAAVNAVLRHGRIVLGPEVLRLENTVARLCGRKYAVAVNSGTDALFLTLKALGIGAGDEVITTSLSWIATANAIALTGATPVFADIRDDLNIDPLSVKLLITRKTKVILPVHYTGKVCEMKELLEIAKMNRLVIVEDAAQSFGALYGGRVAGSFGIAACFSMNPMKVLAACGEAGIIVMDKKDIRERLVALRYNGTVNRETCIEPSLNGRIDTIQAAILLKRLLRVKCIIKKRRQIAASYSKKLDGIVETPREAKGERDVYYTYTIRADRRDELKDYLQSRGIETRIQHPYLMPQQPAYRRGRRGEFANAERLYKRILCIPVNEKLNRNQVDFVAASIKKFYTKT